jgi:hypothetical protein
MQWFDIINLVFLLLIWTIIFSDFRRAYIARKYWVLFFGVYTITELISVWLAWIRVNNLWVYNISKPVQFFCLVFYFVNITKLSINSKKKILYVAIIASVFFLYANKYNEYSSLQDIFYGAILISFCIKYFYDTINNQVAVQLSLSEFWYCCSLFIFFGANLCINGSLNYLLKYEMAIAQKLFYGLVYNSYIFYCLTIFALQSSKKN